MSRPIKFVQKVSKKKMGKKKLNSEREREREREREERGFGSPPVQKALTTPTA